MSAGDRAIGEFFEIQPKEFQMKHLKMAFAALFIVGAFSLAGCSCLSDCFCDPCSWGNSCEPCAPKCEPCAPKCNPCQPTPTCEPGCPTYKPNCAPNCAPKCDPCCPSPCAPKCPPKCPPKCAPCAPRCS